MYSIERTSAEIWIGQLATDFPTGGDTGDGCGSADPGTGAGDGAQPNQHSPRFNAKAGVIV